MTQDREAGGYRAPQVCKLVGITYRQLDYWARTGLIVPTLAQAHGSGSQRRYSFSDVVQLKVIKNLLDAGMSLKKIRSAVEILRSEMDSEQPLADVTLLSDGQTIYAAHSDEEVVDVLRACEDARFSPDGVTVDHARALFRRAESVAARVRAKERE